MKVKMGNHFNTKVLLNNGHDITPEMHIKSVEHKIEAGEPPVVVITCFVDKDEKTGVVVETR